MIIDDQVEIETGAHSANCITATFIATYGGGTGLPTQQGCSNLLGCAGEGKVRKLAESIGATVLAGELSLMNAVLSGDWVASHNNLGRNR